MGSKLDRILTNFADGIAGPANPRHLSDDDPVEPHMTNDPSPEDDVAELVEHLAYLTATGYGTDQSKAQLRDALNRLIDGRVRAVLAEHKRES